MNPKNEPVGWAGAITALAVAGIPLFNAFGAEITPEQSSSILAFLAATIVFVTLLVRSQVTPVGKAEETIDKAYDAVRGVDPKPALTDGAGFWSQRFAAKTGKSTQGKQTNNPGMQ